MFFSVITKSLNPETLTKNLVTFKLLKGGMGSRMKNLYYGSSLKNPIFREGFTKNQYIERNCLKGEAWTV